MKTTMRAAIAVVAVAALGGCAPTMHLAVQSPNCASRAPWLTHSRMNVNAVTQRVQTVQSRFTAGYQFQRMNPDTWRGAASGECR